MNKGDVVHLTCHGKYEEKEPLESALLLSDDIITADEIDDMEMENWPLIFANACSTGAISDKIVGVGGIARAFLEAGAIAFLGPLFEIPDDIAIDFAKEFYNNLRPIYIRLGRFPRDDVLRDRLYAAYQWWGDKIEMKDSIKVKNNATAAPREPKPFKSSTTNTARR